MNPPSESSLQNRDIRQRELVPPTELAGWQILVVGVGAIGRQVALQLAALGVTAMTLIDPDVVAVENLAPQGYLPQDMGQAKVSATGHICRQIHPELQLVLCQGPFRRSSVRTLECLNNPMPTKKLLALFCCVDSISTRRLIWESCRNRLEFFVDGRMNGEVMRMLASGRPAEDEYYPSTLFAQAEAFTGSCTARSTIYAASVAAGLMVGQFAKRLRGLRVERDLTLNLLAAELSIV